MLSFSLVTAAYIGSTILFILSLGGLSNPETARRGNWFGVAGMTIAVVATVFGPRVQTLACRSSSSLWRQVAPLVSTLPKSADDADAGVGCAHAQPRRPSGLRRWICELHRQLHDLRRH